MQEMQEMQEMHEMQEMQEIHIRVKNTFNKFASHFPVK
jgi:two-component sensor histidine kinase